MNATYNKGDFVEASRGEVVIRGYIENIGQGAFISIPDAWIESLEFAGFTIQLINSAKPENALPTEPGVYCDVDGDIWVVDQDESLVPLSESSRRLHEKVAQAVETKPQSYAPFTRLYPEGEATK